MAVRYISYPPHVLKGQAVLNFNRTNRQLIYKGDTDVEARISHGMRLYEVVEKETHGDNPANNIIMRGECVSACAWLRDNNISVDLVYIDPPFASGADYAKKIVLRRNPKIQETMAKAQKELGNDELQQFEAKMYGDIWNKETYLNWMYENLMAIKSVMSPNASIYVHLDYHIGHYVKILMDEIFGENNFRNEIIWKRKGGNLGQTSQYGIVTDSIFYYSKSNNYIFHTPYTKEGQEEYLKRFCYDDGDGRKYSLSPLVSPSYSPSLIYEYKGFAAPANGWSVSKETMEKYEAEGRLFFPKDKSKRIRRKQYLDEWPGSPVQNLWTDIFVINSVAEERIGYATQKPEALLERIIKASSNEGMVVADFFGGSGVTAAVADRLGRSFIHVDVNRNSITTTRDRLVKGNAQFRQLEINDGVTMMRNPAQTMDKLPSLIDGLKKDNSFGSAWFGYINNSRLGITPVYIPDLKAGVQSAVFTVADMLKLIYEEFEPLADKNVKKVIIYYIERDDPAELKECIKNHNRNTLIEVEFRDLKEVLDMMIVPDTADWRLEEISDGLSFRWQVTIDSFHSDRISSLIEEFNTKSALNKKGGKDIVISENGLETIEWLGVDCDNAGESDSWKSTSEIKIENDNTVTVNGKKTRQLWDGTIKCDRKPLRLKIRNICGDESVYVLNIANEN